MIASAQISVYRLRQDRLGPAIEIARGGSTAAARQHGCGNARPEAAPSLRRHGPASDRRGRDASRVPLLAHAAAAWQRRAGAG